jgi:hypothetical protein
MTKLQKTALVGAGYLLAPIAAFVIATLAGSLEGARDQGGMQAFGDLLLFAGFTVVLALIPTAFALYFLRPVATFWTCLPVACIALAATGPVAAIIVPRMQDTTLLQFFGLMRLLGAPLLAFGFLVVALIAPARRARRVVLAAMALEGAVGAYVFFSLLVVGRWLL